MGAIDVTLILPEQLAEGIRSGRLYLDGGVVRETGTARIAGLLRDADVIEGPFADLLMQSVVPLALQGVTFAALERRLEAVEAELRRLRDAVARVQVAVDRGNAVLDGIALGRLLGTLHACALDLEAGRDERLPAYRAELLVAWHSLELVVRGLARDPDIVRQYPEVVAAYARAAQLAAVAARDLTRRLDGAEAALGLAREVAAAGEALAAEMARLLARPPSLFWLEAPHRRVGRELQIAARRLAGHAETLALASPATLARLGERPLAR
jgi:hypothetical protein